ncbi:MAG TPA: aspartyl-phosphate phosphatase Spo0E family protein [Clostridia bacterium]|jgi:hypothetical protein|nr:aspartyl-phosphate phosphatase Spo0E family protein [Clostridia bacterium]
MNILKRKQYVQSSEHIKAEIERLRQELNKLIDNKENNFLDPDVIKLSQLLDKFINYYMQEFKNNF